MEDCQLMSDFGQLAAGDETEIGAKGINLSGELVWLQLARSHVHMVALLHVLVSGGQRQRINTARAVYAAGDVILFDDPLSALDAHVASALFHDVGHKQIASSRYQLFCFNKFASCFDIDTVY